MESLPVLMSSCEDEDDNDDDEDEDDDDIIELSLKRTEYSTEDEDEEDDESNIVSTNVDSPSNSLVIELWSCWSCGNLCFSLPMHAPPWQPS